MLQKNFQLFATVLLMYASLVTSVVFAREPSADKHAKQTQDTDPALTEVWQPKPKEVGVSPSQRLVNPPSDAIVLFDGKSLSEWSSANTGKAASWKVLDGFFQVVPGSGDMVSKQTFCDMQLHIEWRSPARDGAKGQNRGNSGIFLQQRYEVQVLDSWQSDTYVNGQAAAVYKQAAPLVNASTKPGLWQSYDIIFTAPTFVNGKLKAPAYVTVLHNGVLVQNHTEILGNTVFRGAPEYVPHACDSVRLQDHGAKVEYRNIWVRAL